MKLKASILVGLLVMSGLFSLKNAETFVKKLNYTEIDSIITAIKSVEIIPAAYAVAPTGK